VPTTSMSTSDRLTPSEEGQHLLNQVQKEGAVSENLFRLLENFHKRLYRIETGEFPTTEAPTKPDLARKSTQKFSAVQVTRHLVRK
jgi:hypothetical protein